MRDQLKYDPDTDLWRDERDGTVHLECDARSGRPVFVDVTGSRWEGEINGMRFFIDWSPEILNVSPHMAMQAREATLILLKRRSPTWLNLLRLTFKGLRHILPEHVLHWRDVTMDIWHSIWTSYEIKSYLYHMRVLYKQIALSENNSDMLQRYNQISSYKIGKKEMLGEAVSWNPTKGAFIDEELEKIMQFLRKPGRDSAIEHCMRILAWLYLRSGKRPLQLLSIGAGGLSRVTHNGMTQFYLRIPKVKAQRGRRAELWEISADLAAEIQRFSERPEIRQLQQDVDRLLVLDMPGAERNKWVNSSTVSIYLSNFFKRAGITMQRDRNLPPEPLVFNARRARHTVGTQLAFEGAPSEYISWVLEHDSPVSARAYIDAVASLIHDAINRADHTLGGIFSGLAETYFSGHLVDDLTDRPIFIPDLTEGLFPVGSCGLNTEIYGECRKHPFYSCFGCASFLTWRGGDFTRARFHVQSLLQRWLDAAGQPERSQLIIEFERLYQAILYVETQISEPLR